MNAFLVKCLNCRKIAKKAFAILIVVTTGCLCAFAQAPTPATQETSFSSIFNIDSVQNATPVVIIDDDELGITISPNPAINYINIHANGNSLNNKTFKIINSLGIVVLEQPASGTVTLTGLSTGTYTWIIVVNNNPNQQPVSDGLLIVL